MNKIKAAVDYAIRGAEKMDEKSGYEANGKLYDKYMSNSVWDSFLATIPTDIQKKLTLEISSTPPKMASFGSSSRFAYNLLHGVDGIEFEYDAPTKVGNSAQLDAYLKGLSSEIFVEAKCHEIYDKNHRGGKAYSEVYKHLCKVDENFNFNPENFAFYYNGEEILRFDLKQLICHYLGLSSLILEGKIRPNICFLYLIYNPEMIAEHIDECSKQDVVKTYKDTLKEMEYFKEWLFDAVFEFQKSNLRTNIKIHPAVKYNFKFHLVDQVSYKEFFEQK